MILQSAHAINPFQESQRQAKEQAVEAEIVTPAVTTNDELPTPNEVEGFKVTPPGTPTRKLGRNDPCWCGSGKKYKKCHWPD